MTGPAARTSLARERIALREVKETRRRLEILRAAGLVTNQHDEIIDEAGQLARILSTIIRNADRGNQRRLVRRRKFRAVDNNYFSGPRSESQLESEILQLSH